MLKNISLTAPSWWLDVEKKLVYWSLHQHGTGVPTTPSQWETTSKHSEFALFCTQREATSLQSE